jgi:ATP-binding cassette, subfamily C (CFTR/MRP), member 4
MGDFQHLVTNGLDFSAFLSYEEGREEADDDEIHDDKLPDIRDIELIRKRIRTRTLSITSDVSQRSAMREELHSNEKKDTDSEAEEEEEKHLQKEQQQQPTQEKETKSVGSVNLMLYWNYFKAGGNAFAVVFMLVVNILCQVLYSGSDIWISYWTSEEEERIVLNGDGEASGGEVLEVEDSLPSPVIQVTVQQPPNISSANYSSLLETGRGNNLTEHYLNLGIYAAMVLGLVVTSMVRTVYFFVLCMRSSVNLHNAMFRRIISAPCRFFDTNPVGKAVSLTIFFKS